MTLTDAIRLWPTPSAGNFNDGEDLASFDARRVRQKAKGINGNGMGDTLAIAAQRTNWPTPAATEMRQGYQRRPEGMASEQNQQSLSTIAMDFPSPLQGLPIPAGPQSSPSRRSLNPLFVEWLMRWPIGWSACACSATESIRWRRLMRTYVSTLDTTAHAASGQLGLAL